MPPRDDAPPDAANAIALAILAMWGPPVSGNPAHIPRLLVRQRESADILSRAAVLALRALPDAEVWRLIGWLAEGREPTQAMLCEANKRVAICTPDGTWALALDEARRVLRTMLYAAREGGTHDPR